jgi:HEAT repeat protein
MEQRGLQPIELERYSCSNKIWTTKVKRLRLPDLISCNTGQRVEVRAKSKLAIKMSDSPSNPTRRWNFGLRKEDLVAFVHAFEDGGKQAVADSVELFSVGELEAVARRGSVLGSPKSSSEGAERDREWRTIVPSSDGTVERIKRGGLTIRRADGRRYTYDLGNKTPYARVGDSFNANRCFLAGTPRRKAEWPAASLVAFEPHPLLRSHWEVDRYAAAKVLGYVGGARDRTSLLEIAQSDADPRVRLEAACSLARLGFPEGMETLASAVKHPAEPYLRMEVALMLAEFAGCASEQAAADLLVEIAKNPELSGQEVRQAAIWGLGKAGLRRFSALIPFLDSDDEDERLHAIAAFEFDMPDPDVTRLVRVLEAADSSDKKLGGAAFVLARLTASPRLIALLARPAMSAVPRVANWARAVLGQFPPDVLAHDLQDPALRQALEPISLLTGARNWTLTPDIASELHFLEQQNL